MDKNYTISRITSVTNSKTEEEKIVNLDLSSGNQIVEPTTTSHVMSKVTINKPEMLIPSNIRKNIDIAGVTGTLEEGGGEIPPYSLDHYYPATFNKINGGYDISDLSEYFNRGGMAYTKMINMFSNNRDLKTIPFINTSFVTDMTSMFEGCSSLNTIPAIDTTRVSIMDKMFYGCTFLNKVPIFKTGSLLTAYSMFENCTYLKTVPQIDLYNTSDIHAMFKSCENLESVTLANSTSNLRNISEVCEYCYKLTTATLPETTSVENMTHAFNGCSELTTINGFDIDNTTDMSYMFSGCTKLTTISLYGINKKSIDLNSTFNNCISLKSIGYSENVAKALKPSYLNYTFYNCKNLESIGFTIDCNNINEFWNTFAGCNKLQYVTLINVHADLDISQTAINERYSLESLAEGLLDSGDRTLKVNETQNAIINADQSILDILALKNWKIQQV